MAYISVNKDQRKSIPLKVEMETEKFTAGEIIEDYYDTRKNGLKDTSIPAGAIGVEIRNNDPTGSIFVNGEELTYNKIWNRQKSEDKVNCKVDYVPAVTIVGNGKHWVGSVEYPSSSGLTSQNIF